MVVKSRGAPAPAGPYVGLFSRAGMPGHLRVGYERASVKLADGFRVLLLDEGPAEAAVDGGFFLVIGAGGIAVGVILEVRERRRARAPAAASGG